jgi:hypothetical protein
LRLRLSGCVHGWGRWHRVCPCPTNRQRTKPAIAPTYTEWKSRAGALLERQGLSLGIKRERDLRQLYIRGKAPEDAARQAETAYYNTRPPFERTRRR